MSLSMYKEESLSCARPPAESNIYVFSPSPILCRYKHRILDKCGGGGGDRDSEGEEDGV